MDGEVIFRFKETELILFGDCKSKFPLTIQNTCPYYDWFWDFSGGEVAGVRNSNTIHSDLNGTEFVLQLNLDISTTI